LRKRFDIDLIIHICEILEDAYADVDDFHGDTYKQALLEFISKDDDYTENNGFKIENNKFWFKPMGVIRQIEERVQGIERVYYLREKNWQNTWQNTCQFFKVKYF